MRMTHLPERFVFRSSDLRFGLTIPDTALDVLLGFCVGAGVSETGGILIGHYAPALDMAIVTQVSGPPDDSSSGRSFFTRGTRGLQSLLNRLWRRRQYYLGEWHFHPYATPIASGRDRRQMLAFARDHALKCPEPVLLLIGGDPQGNWQVAAFVFPKDTAPVAMEMEPRTVEAQVPENE